MKILNVITGLRRAAGTSTFCGEVSNVLVASGHDLTIAVCPLEGADSYTLDPTIHFVSINFLCNSSVADFDVVHIHGLWSWALHRVSKWAHGHHLPVVWSTHGMTAPWALRHKWWKKLPAWLLYQKWDLKRAAAIHCTTELEVDWNKKLGFKNCFVAPLGTRLPDSAAGLGRRSRSTAEGRTLLFVGRIYPVKALDRLIEAFARVEESVRRNWVLRLVGPDQAGHMAELMALCGRLGMSYSTPEQESAIHCTTTTSGYNSTIQFAGPKFSQDLDSEYDNCDCLALVSHTENFGATVVDAMAHGKPVITSTTTPWKIVADNRCGWWVSNEIEPLSAALVELMTSADADRIEMGGCGRKLVSDRYTWSAVCDKIVRKYEEVLR